MRRVVILTGIALSLLMPAAATASDVPTPRLDALAAQLRDSPLAVDDDVGYLLSTAERRRLVADLRDSPVPFHVALLPALDEDESGGDQARQLDGLFTRLRKPGVYLAVDERGGIEVGSDRVPRELAYDYDLAYGGSSLDEDEPPAAETVAQRIREFVRVTAAAPPGEATPFDTSSRPQPLPEIEVKRGDDLVVFAVFMGVGGVLAGGLLFLLALGGARLVRGPHA